MLDSEMLLYLNLFERIFKHFYSLVMTKKCNFSIKCLKKILNFAKENCQKRVTKNHFGVGVM